MCYITGMSTDEIRKLIEERTRLLEELGTLSQLLHGSWIERFSVCSRPNCRCHQGERHGPRHYLVINEKGRQRQRYIPNLEVEAARKGISQHHRLLEIVDRITYINLALIKERKYGRN